MRNIVSKLCSLRDLSIICIFLKKLMAAVGQGLAQELALSPCSKLNALALLKMNAKYVNRLFMEY